MLKVKATFGPEGKDWLYTSQELRVCKTENCYLNFDQNYNCAPYSTYKKHGNNALC